jgi:hypothetical protein
MLRRSSMKVIKSEGLANGTPHAVGQYLKSYDVEAHGGRGEIVWTSRVEEAMRFDGNRDAFECWKRVPECHPVRLSDGKPNRPLTAFTITIEDAPDGT